jgi:glutamine amidotransferase
VERISGSTLLEGLDDRFYAYFIHSYAFKGREPFVKAVTRRGGEVFAAVVEEPPIYATQFHPERSGRRGLAILRNFVNLSK